MPDSDGAHPSTTSIAGRLGYMEGKVKALENTTRSTFTEVKESVKDVHSAVSDVNQTLAVINERMVTKHDCHEQQAECKKSLVDDMRKLGSDVHQIGRKQEMCELEKDHTDPHLQIPVNRGLTADGAKKWIGVVVAMLGLLGFGSISTCVSHTMGNVENALTASQRKAEKQQAALRQEVLQQLKTISETPPAWVKTLPRMGMSPDAGVPSVRDRRDRRDRRYRRTRPARPPSRPVRVVQ